MFRSMKTHCFKFRRIFHQIDVVRRGTSANRRKYSSIFFRCMCGVFSGDFLNPNEFFPQTDANFPRKKSMCLDSTARPSARAFGHLKISSSLSVLGSQILKKDVCHRLKTFFLFIKIKFQLIIQIHPPPPCHTVFPLFLL